jgi:hypothetical protein
MFHKGCGICIPADPFWSRGLAGTPANFLRDPIGNEMSASVYKSNPPGCKTGCS